MATVYMMVGIPGAGKTTYAKEVLSHCVYLGTDAIRKELFGKELTLKGRKKVYQHLCRRMLYMLDKDRDVVVDCTNITQERRRRLLNLIPASHRCVAVHIDTPLLQALQNNRKRDRHVPAIGIISMYLKLTKPQMSEGFWKVIRIENSGARIRKKISAET